MTDASPATGSASTERLTRGRVAAALVLLFVAAFALRAFEHDAYLPNVLYSDYVQVDQAADLLLEGKFVERSSYPLTHTFVLAGVDAAAYGVGWAFGDYTHWNPFVKALASKKDPTLRHSIARLYTALLGAGTVIAVYFLARARASRAVSLLAAVLLAASPAHVIYAHQSRIHVPGIFLLTWAAAAIVRAGFGGGGLARSFLAGAACGAAASVFQLGFVLAAAACPALFVLTPSRRRGAASAAAAAAGSAAAFGLVMVLTHAVPWSVPAAGSGALENVGTLGIPSTTLSGFSFARFADRFPELVVNWILAEPIVAVGVLTFLATWRRRRGSRGDLAAFGLYPAAVFLALGTTYTEVRYSLSTTPFLVVLAAMGLTSVPALILRAPLVALAVAVPLATTVRYDWLLTKPDSRIFLDGVLPALAGAGCQVAVEDSLRLPAARFPPKISQFPPNGDYSKWAFGRESPVATLRSLDSNVFVCATGSSSPYEVPEHALRALGFVLCARLPASPSERTVLPDAPENLIASIWRAKRSGPTLDFFSKGEVFRRLQAMLAAESIVKFQR